MLGANGSVSARTPLGRSGRVRVVRARERAKPVVFLGPSLAIDEARTILDADYRPPVRKGDVYACLATRVSTIAIIDGVFHGEPSVWHREILEALDAGIEVHGASSMGALRGAELAVHGMQGSGTIFAWYRDGVIDGDDKVALHFGPAECGYRALSEPLVNLRATLDHAVTATGGSRTRGVTREEARAILEWLKALFYPDRSYRAIERACPVFLAMDVARREALSAFFRGEAVDLKRRDAIGLLEALAKASKSVPERAPSAAPSDRSPRISPDRHHEWLRHRRFPDGGTGPSRLAELAANPPLDRLLREVLARRFFLGAWAEERAVRCPPEVRTAFAERHSAATARLGDGSLTAGEIAAWIDEASLADWLRARGASAFGLASGADPDAAFIADWAQERGVVAPAGESLVFWILTKGPRFFGFRDDLDGRRLRELEVRRVGIG